MIAGLMRGLIVKLCSWPAVPLTLRPWPRSNRRLWRRSGPCAPDPSGFADALDVLLRRDVQAAAPASVLEHLRRGARGELPETPKPGDAIFDKVRHTVVARNADAVRAADAAATQGTVVLLAPACTSFDQYAGYEARGDDFRARVNALPGHGVAAPERPVKGC